MLFLLLNPHWRRRAKRIPVFGAFLLRLELVLLVMVCMGVIYGLAEHASWFDSLWLVWQTITTVGYGDIPPKTAAGRAGVMACGTIAILMLSYVVSAGLDYRDDKKERRRLGLDRNRESGSHILVCCRNEEELLAFISELRCVQKDAPVCVVDDVLKGLPEKAAALPNVAFVHGSLLARDTYERAGIATCCEVFVFPHDPDKDSSDATTQTIVSLVERMVPANVRIIHFLVNPDNEDLFEGLRSRPVYADFAIYAAIQESQDEGSADIFLTLMSNTHGANPTTFYPDKIVGWTWGRFSESALKVSLAQKIPVNPLALIHQGKSDPCPDMDRVIENGDALSLIVHRTFSYPAFEQELVKGG